MELSKKARQWYREVLDDIKKYSVDKPIKSKHLERKFQLAGATIREIVHYLRVNLEPIGSKNGYFYARTQSEIQHTINDLRSRCRSITEAVDGLVASFQPASQTNMFQEDKPKNKSNYDIE